MQYIRAAVAGFAVIAFAAACGTERVTSPTDAVTTSNVTASSTACASYSQIVALSEVVFAPNASEVTGKLSAINHQLNNNNLPNARSKGMELIGFILKKNSQNQVAGTQAQVTHLVNDILCWLGIAGAVPAAANAFVINPGSTKSDTIVNSQANAGVILPAGAVSEPTIITIAPIPFTPTGSGSGPLLTKLDQYPGFFDISKISATNAPLLQPVVVAVCPAPFVPVSVRASLRLGHQAAAGPAGFLLRPPANANFLSCPVSAPISMSQSISTFGAGAPVAKSADADFLSATGGVGGTTGTFSPFGTVDGTLSATGGVGGTTGTFIRMGEFQSSLMFDGRPLVVAACSEATLGSAVPAECRPTVSITTALGTKLQNVPVSFAVTQGNGSVASQTLSGCGAFNSSATVTTSNFGIAVVCWNLGAVAGVNSVTATPSTGGDVPASAVFSPSTLVFNMNGVVSDITPPVISDPVITGTQGLDDWYTSDVSVSWKVSDPETAFTTSGCSASLTSDNAGVTFTCSATNAVGLTSSRTITLKRDASVPTGTVSVTGEKGSNDWFISNVDVKWTLTANGPSGLGASAGCNDLVVSTNEIFSYTCIPRSRAGLSGASVVGAGKRDASIPTVSVAVDGTKGDNDWFVSDVTVAWKLTANGPSGLGAPDGCADVVIATDGSFSPPCTVVSGAGVSSQTLVASGKRDATKPVVSYSGNSGSYGVDAFVAITCGASDVTSGIASTSCTGAQGAAYSFNVGLNLLSATATDFAGNVGAGSASFTVVLTSTSLCTLARRFSSSTGVANSLCSKLDNIAKAAARGDGKAKAGMVGAFTNEVSAQTGKAFNSVDAAVLLRLVKLL